MEKIQQLVEEKPLLLGKRVLRGPPQVPYALMVCQSQAGSWWLNL